MKKVLSILLGIAFVFGFTVSAAGLSAAAQPILSQSSCAIGSWCLFGNAGTSNLNFIGTTDAQDLTFKTNNVTRMTLTAGVGSDSILSIKTNVGIKSSKPKANFQVGGSVMFGSNHLIPLATNSNAGDNNSSATNSINSSILGGELNSLTDTSSASSIGGGKNNKIDGDYSFIGGGDSNIINGSNSVIPGGYSNYATNNAFAAGMYASAKHKYSFVWNDGSINPFITTNTSQFLINASRGVGINTNNTSDATLTVNGTIKSSYKAANGSIGITKIINLKNSAGKSCTMTINDGIITATSC